MSIVTRGMGGRLMTHGYGGPLEYIVIVPEGPNATFENVFIAITRQNTYTGITVTLNEDWEQYLAAAENISVHFTVKKRWVDALEEALIDKLGTTQAENILFNLTTSDTDIPERDYLWQLQVRNDSGEVVKTPIGGRLEVDPILRKVEPVAP